MKSYIKSLATMAAAALVSPVFASTGNFTSPLTSAFLSVDLNGGQNSANNETTEGWGSSGPLGPDNFGVQWTPWGGNTGTGGDGTQLPNSSAAVTATSITKSFGSVNATVSLDALNLVGTGSGTYYSGSTINSRDRGTPSGTLNDGDLFRDLIFAGTANGPIQGMNLLQLQFTGLTAGTAYEIALYSFDTTGSHSMNWTAMAPTVQNGRDGYWDGTADGNFTAPTDEQTLTWASGTVTPAPAILTVTADGSGDITVYGFGGNGVSGNQSADTSYLNGFQLAVAPEPASVALLGLGLAGLVIRSRKA